MNEFINDMQSKGLINFERQPLFGAKLGVNENQLTAWKYFDGKLAKLNEMKHQRLLPATLNPYSNN